MIEKLGMGLGTRLSFHVMNCYNDSQPKKIIILLGPEIDSKNARYWLFSMAEPFLHSFRGQYGQDHRF